MALREVIPPGCWSRAGVKFGPLCAPPVRWISWKAFPLKESRETSRIMRASREPSGVSSAFSTLLPSIERPSYRIRVYYDVNVEGTRRLAEACLAEGGIPFIYCSTCGVHGEVQNPPVDEMAPYNPGDIYQETKVEAEKVVLALHRERGLPATILRPVGIYGPGDRRFLKLFGGVARGRFPLIGSGEVLYHLTHVEDVARGFLKAADTPEAQGETFILAGERYTSIKELIELIASGAGVAAPRVRVPVTPVYMAAVVCEGLCRPLGIEPPLHRRRLDFFLKDRAFRIDKAKERLGWRPQVDLEEGIRETLGWYREKGWI